MSKTSALTLLCLFGPMLASGQTLPQLDGHTHLGVATCASSQCHGSAVPRTEADVQQSEYVSWTNADPHAGAFASLMTPESAAIAMRLGITAAAESGECLNCHADNVPAAMRGERFQISDGVGCEACHGGAENWLVSHYNDSDSNHAANVAAGLYPADAASRAKLCLSCHLGTDQKFASHRLMAAGHPRLSFELDTFSELWRLAGNPPHYLMDADYADRKSTLDHAETWIAGLVATVEQQLQLLSGPVLTTGGAFPELGLFDCHACHRTMQEIAWRPLSRYGDIGPGNPLLNDSSVVMLIAVGRGLGRGGETLQEQLRALHRATTEGTDAMAQAAGNFRAALESLAPTLMDDDLSNAQKRRILREVGQAAQAGEFLDYTAAEQAFMAVQTLAFDLQDQALADRIVQLASMLENDEAYEPERFGQLMASLVQ